MTASTSVPEDAPGRAWSHYTGPSWIEVDGLPTAYRRKGDGPPLLYLHGAGLTRMWLPFYEELSQSFDVIVPEHPGFGDTGLPEWLDGFDDLVLHYDALLRALDLDTVHLVGHSLGGWIAADMAIFYPERFPTLTLLTPIGVRLPDGIAVPDPFRLGEATADLLFNGRADTVREYLEQEGELEDAVRAYSEGIAFARLTWNPRYDHRLDRRLARVRAATLVVGADDDRIVPNEMAARFASLIPGAQLRVIHGDAKAPTGHAFNVERPAETASLVCEHVTASRRRTVNAAPVVTRGVADQINDNAREAK